MKVYVVTLLSDFLPPIGKQEREVLAPSLDEARKIAHETWPRNIVANVRRA